MIERRCTNCFYWCENNDTGEECYGNDERLGCHEFIPNIFMPIFNDEVEQNDTKGILQADGNADRLALQVQNGRVCGG